jgi:hypothetical protein
MVTVRPVDWARDEEGLSALDTSLVTDRVYDVEAEVDQRVVGLAAAHYSAWNARVVLWHLTSSRAIAAAGRAQP